MKWNHEKYSERNLKRWFGGKIYNFFQQAETTEVLWVSQRIMVFICRKHQEERSPLTCAEIPILFFLEKSEGLVYNNNLAHKKPFPFL